MSANIKTQGKRIVIEIIKWLCILTLPLLSVIGNCIYSDFNLFLRVLITILIIVIAISVIATTNKGKQMITFVREARTEIRKVIWPTYKETLHTTLIVTIVTAVMSMILWILDGLLIYLVSFITSMRF